MLERMPIRLRLVAAFAVMMTALCVVAIVATRIEVRNSLDHAIDQGLRSRIDDLTTSVASTDPTTLAIPQRTLVTEESSFAQVLSSSNQVLASSERFAGESALSSKQAKAALRHAVEIERGDDGITDSVRILATTATLHGRRVIVLVGTSLDVRTATLDRLDTRLYIGGAISILLATLVGYLVAARALRAIERIRAAAAGIDHRSIDAQLPVPIARDELRSMTTTLNDLLRRLSEAFQRERRFIEDASHELRTPVALIKSELELALLEPHEVDDVESSRRYISSVRQRLASAESEADRLGQLATSLLIVAQEEDRAGTTSEGSPETCDATTSITLAVHRFENRAANEGRTITVVGADSTSDVHLTIDAIRFEQACSNLVDNALRHGAGDITITTSTSDRDFSVRVSDGGDGIPRGVRPHAFERFARGASTAGAASGAGLGLAIVQMIARSSGGDASIDGDGFVTLCVPRAA